MNTESVAERYARFARDEAPGRSAVYAEWAAGVAGDSDVLATLETLGAAHREPALVFGVTRMLGTSDDLNYEEWARFFRANRAAIIAECARRTVQTNDPLRLAALVPALSTIKGRIALLEIGASAGLCLFPDRYSFRYVDEAGEGVARLDPAEGPSEVMLTSVATGQLPSLRRPEIVWRAGIDLSPVDVTSQAELAWLNALTWPGEMERAQRVEAAIRVAQQDPPRIVQGDAIEQLAILARQVPKNATLVVTTPGVMTYLRWPERQRLMQEIAMLGARWLTIDPPSLYDAWKPLAEQPGWRGFAVGVDGVPVASADPLGRWSHWF